MAPIMESMQTQSDTRAGKPKEDTPVNTPFETIMYKGFHIDIYPDPVPLNPAEEFDFFSEDEVQAYYDGDVYGFIVRETGDSVWGFYGLDLTEAGGICLHAYDAIDTEITNRSNAYAQLDTFDAAELLAV